MKVNAALIAALASTASANLSIRDASDIIAIIDQNVADINALKAAADGFAGDKAPLLTAADKMIADIKDAVPKVKAHAILTQDETFAIAGSVGNLEPAAQSLVDAFKAKLPVVEQYRECDTVRSKLGDIDTNARALIGAVINIVDPSLHDFAQGLADEIGKVLDQAKTAYAGCTNAAAPSSSAPPSSSNPPASSTAPPASSSVVPSGSASQSSAVPSSSQAPSGTKSGSSSPSGTNKPTGGNTTLTVSCSTTTPQTTPTGGAHCPKCTGSTGGNTGNGGNGGNGGNTGGNTGGNNGGNNGGNTGTGGDGSTPVVVTGGAKSMFAPAAGLAMIVAALIL